jgi:hypothetical protein
MPPDDYGSEYYLTGRQTPPGLEQLIDTLRAVHLPMR